MCNITTKFGVRQHVRISKEKMKFTTGTEQNFSQKIYWINKVIKRTTFPFYEVEDLNKRPIEGQFYQEELTPMRMTKTPLMR